MGQVQGSEWAILTPDYDRYIEEMSHLNSDFTDFIYLGATTDIPARVPDGPASWPRKFNEVGWKRKQSD